MELERAREFERDPLRDRSLAEGWAGLAVGAEPERRLRTALAVDSGRTASAAVLMIDDAAPPIDAREKGFLLSPGGGSLGLTPARPID